MTDSPKKRGRPTGWRKRPDEEPWIAIGLLLPPDVHTWISKHKEELIAWVREQIKKGKN